MRPTLARCWPLWLLALALAWPVLAQEPPAPNIIRLEPKPMAGIKTGRAVVVKGEVGPDGHRFMVDGVTALMPVTVLLRPVRKGEDVGLTLSKYAWNQPLRDGSTDGDTLKFRIRTEGEFQITVTAPEPDTDYRLLVWIGDEVKPAMAPIIVKASEFEAPGPAWGSVALWAIAGLLGVIAVLLMVVVLRRKKT